jgi:hypothetical protein
MPNELIARKGKRTALDAMRFSRRALDRPLEGDAELSVVEITTEATVLGAFQRQHRAPNDRARIRRVSGGPFVQVGPGTIHVLLTLANAATLVACDPRRIVNRYVRPLLRGLTKAGALAHYFGRDWVSVSHQPVGQVGFAHDSRTGRTAFEAFVAVRHEFAPPGRASFRGRVPTTLEAVSGRVLDIEALSELIVVAYASECARVAVPRPWVRDPDDSDEALLEDDPPWTASVDEAIGELAAGRDAGGTFRLGGDLLASRDALERVTAHVAALSTASPSFEADVAGIVDRELSQASVALDGVRDLKNVRDVLVTACRTAP